MSYNHRVSIFTTPTANIEYLYNANNQRVAKKVNGTIVEKYLWANLTTLLAIYDKDDNLIQRFEYSDGRMPTSMTQNNTKYYLHYDQVGSLRAISDTSGNIIKEITYDTYGNILSDTNANLKVPFGFAGGLLDKDTGLTRFGYRDYDSYTGKWTAKDPIDFSGGDTNLYGYVLGDPVNFVDVDGKAKHDPNSQYCLDLQKKIKNIAEQIKKRIEELDADINCLPLYKGPGEKAYETKRGHDRLVTKLNKQLDDAIKKYDDSCGGGGSPETSTTSDYFPKSVPLPKPFSGRNLLLDLFLTPAY